jgi:DNA gyrase/topoisomerase IV subunit A
MKEDRNKIDEVDMIGGSVTERELGELSTELMMLYGLNVNARRSIPMLDDGLKPVIRRILYIMYKYHRMNKTKVSTAIGELLTIHPHGDQGAGGIFSRMAQNFTNNVPLLDVVGNAGNAVAGDDFASPRYLFVKMSQFAMDVFFDEFDGQVNMIDAEDGGKEPYILPAKFPTVLLNGTSGIGYTVATDIYPYNLSEIADATIKLLKNPSANINLIPDLPTGCDIIAKGKDVFIMQSSFDVDNVNYIITIKNTPYMSFLDNIDKALRAIQDSPNPIPEIISADDESDLLEGKVRYVIRCNPCNLYNVINTLFKRVPGFRSTIVAATMLVVENLRPVKYDTRQILLAWIKSRLVQKRGVFLRRLVKINTDLNMLEGKELMLSPENLNRTIKVFRACNSRKEIVPALVKEYKGLVSTSQANYLSEIKMYALTNDEHTKTVEQIEKVREEIEYMRSVVEVPERIRDVVIDELKEIKVKYGCKRKSKILNYDDGASINISVAQILADGTVIFSETDTPESLASDITPITDEQVCLIDELGNFTWIDTTSVYHDKPMTLTSVGKMPMGKCMFVSSSLDNDIVILTNKGRIKYMPISKIPSTNGTRKPIMPGLGSSEYIVSMLELNPSVSADLFVYTNDGRGKRIPVTSLNKMYSVDALGQNILNDSVNGMFVIDSKKPYLLYVSRLGRLRLNHNKYLSTVKKFADPKPVIKLSAQDDLIAVFCVDQNQSVVLNHMDGRVTTVNIDSLNVTTMSTDPVRPKHVPAVKLIRATVSAK